MSLSSKYKNRITANMMNRNTRLLQNQKGNRPTMGVNIPRQAEGAVGDITVRDIGIFGLRCYIKTDSGWYDINTMQSANKTQWTPMVLVNSHATNTTYGEPAYFKDTSGFVHLRGGVDSGNHNATIATLPAGFRPHFAQRRIVIPTAAADIILQVINITTGGAINKPYASLLNLSGDSIDNNTSQDICLDGISFFVGQKIVGSGGGTTGGTPSPGPSA